MLTMPLFQVQDGDRPMWVIARDFPEALIKWQKKIHKENPDQPNAIPPQGVAFVCENDELIR